MTSGNEARNVGSKLRKAGGAGVLGSSEAVLDVSLQSETIKKRLAPSPATELVGRRWGTNLSLKPSLSP